MGVKPADACKDVLINARYGGSVPASRLTDADFTDWSTFTDGLDTAVECNIYFDTQVSLPTALAHMGQVGRGQVVMRGTQFGAVWDGAASGVELFTMGNIVPGSFRETFLEMEQRATHIEARYRDEDKDYTWQTLVAVRGDFDETSDEEHRTGITVYASTSRQIVWELITFLLNSNRYLLRVIEFGTGVDAFSSLPGDVFRFQHDVPEWGYGGRVVSADAGSVTVDQTVTVGSGTHRVTIRHSATNTLETVTVTNSPGDTDTLTVAGWTTVPSADDVFLFGPQSGEQLYRLVAIERTHDLECKLKAVQYDANVYGAAGTAPDYETQEVTDDVTNLSVDQEYTWGAGTWTAILTWQGTQAIWNVYYRLTGTGPWTKADDVNAVNGVGEYRFTTGVLGANSYDFLVTWDDNTGQGQQVNTTFSGAPSGDLAPSPPAALELEINDDGYLEASWTGPGLVTFDVEIDGVEVSTDQAAITYTHNAILSGGTHTVRVRGADSFGQDTDWTSDTIQVVEIVIYDADGSVVVYDADGSVVYVR